MGRLFLQHLIGNALLLGVGYYWLGIAESSTPMLGLSFVTLFILVAGTLWLHGTAFAFFRKVSGVHRHFVPLFALAILICVLVWITQYVSGLIIGSAQSSASYLTLKLQRPVSPGIVLDGLYPFVWLLNWAVVPMLVLPIFSGIAARGWSGFSEIGPFKPLHLAIALVFVASIYGPLALALWVPVRGSFAVEFTSLAIRLSLAYLAFTGGLLLVAFMTSLGSPDRNQPMTAARP